MAALLVLAWTVPAPAGEAPAREVPATAADAYARVLEADAAMAAGEYGRAAALYDSAAGSIDRFPEARRALAWDSYRMPYADLARARGALKRAPGAIRHRMLVVYVRRATFEVALPSGRRVAVAAVQDDAAIAAHAVAEENLRQYLEVLTGGAVTVEFRRMTLEGRVTNAFARGSTDYEGEARESIRADLGALRPWPAVALEEFLPEGDSLLVWWPGGDSGASPTGTLEPVPLVPWQLGSPPRIVMQVPSSFRRGNTLLHEFFHGLERLYGVGILHGFLEDRRGAFPGWIGAGQYDYYRWHFERTFAPRGWERMDVSSMYPWRADPAILERHRRLAAGWESDGGPAASRLARAADLRSEAERFLTADPGRAASLLDRAAEANPRAPALHVLQARRALAEGRDAGLEEHSALALELDPRDAGAAYLRGIALGRASRWREAHSCLTLAMALDRVEPLLPFQRAFVNYRLGDAAAALGDCRDCLARDPGFRDRILDFYRPRAAAGDADAGRIVEGI